MRAEEVEISGGGSWLDGRFRRVVRIAAASRSSALLPGQSRDQLVQVIPVERSPR